MKRQRKMGNWNGEKKRIEIEIEDKELNRELEWRKLYFTK